MTSAVRSVLVASLIVFPTRFLSAQTPPPVTGTVALEGTVEQEYKGANEVTVKTVDGVKHVFHVTKDLLVHGGKHGEAGALADLREGQSVVVHFSAEGSDATAQEIDKVGDDGLQVTEGVVTEIDRGRKEITVRFENGTRENFRLTDRAAAGSDKTVARAGDTVVIYYADESGRKVAHYFKKRS